MYPMVMAVLQAKLYMQVSRLTPRGFASVPSDYEGRRVVYSITAVGFSPCVSVAQTAA